MKVEGWDKLKALFAANCKPGVTHRLTVTEMLRSNVSKTVKCSGSVLEGAFMSAVSPTHPLPVQAWREGEKEALDPWLESPCQAAAMTSSLLTWIPLLSALTSDPSAAHLYTWKATKWRCCRLLAVWQFGLETLLPQSPRTRQTCAAEALWWT